MSALRPVGRISRIGKWLKRHGFSLLFGLTLLLMAVMMLWWSFFIRHSVEQQRELSYSSLRDGAASVELLLAQSKIDPKPGPLQTDPRLQITSAAPGPGAVAVSLAPRWPQLWVAASPQYLDKIEADFRLKSLMVRGETAFLLAAILLSGVMLYRSIWLERRSYRELHQLWGRVTHELKTPITGIKAFLQTLQKRQFSQAELAPLLNMALREVERQEMLAENLLVGQRLERGGLGLQIISLSLPQFVREFVAGCQIAVLHGSVDLVVSCAQDTAVQADQDALRVILENLTDNAMKYGGAKPRIAIEVAVDHGRPRVTVSDRGIGFDPAEGERIFAAYQRLGQKPQKGKPVGRHGTGMGLYISRQLARKMGGDLQAFSAGPGKGARFTLTLKGGKGA